MSVGQDFHNQGGRFIHVRSSRGRRITIAYTRENGFLRYGATIFRPIERSDRYLKEANRRYAVQRYKDLPVIIVDNPDWTPIQREQQLRNALTERGCCFYDTEVLSQRNQG